jgi:hypothetical protein
MEETSNDKKNAGEEEGVIRTAGFGGNGARKFSTSRASPPAPSRHVQNCPRELEHDLALEKRNRRAFPGRQEREDFLHAAGLTGNGD